jgi:uncharacterized protein YdeI (YjbR/CyaY-like superfamily)
MTPRFFRNAKAFHDWLDRHHATDKELIVGFHKKDSGKPSITYQEALDEALAYGWIDGVRRSVDTDSYSIRFTPRKPRSIWSAVNVKRVGELIEAGRMTDAGMAAFAKRDEKRTAIYSYERETAKLSAAETKAFKADKKAWEFFEAQPPGYKRLMTHRVVSAKKPETRARRLEMLMEYSRNGTRIPLMGPKKS